MELSVERRDSPEATCPLCREQVQADDRLTCACGVEYHRECHAELGRCVTLGCEGAPAPAEGTRPPASATPPAAHQAPRALDAQEAQEALGGALGPLLVAIGSLPLMIGVAVASSSGGDIVTGGVIGLAVGGALMIGVMALVTSSGPPRNPP
jgi:hypothetical protein